MPDWFYRTVAQRTLFCLPDKASRAVALGLLGLLGRHQSGRTLIDFLGHMDADPRLARQIGATRFRSPLGLGWRVDPEQRASAAFARFGIGFVERPPHPPHHVTRAPGNCLRDDGALLARPSPSPPPPAGCPTLRRHVHADGRETLELPSGEHLPVVSWDADLVRAFATENPAHGIVLQVGERTPGGGWCVPARMPPSLPERVLAWRARLPTGSVLIVAGGVSRPGDAVALVSAGADLVMIDAGLVFHGPGLIKRCNDALLLAQPPAPVAAASAPPTQFRRASFWATALGAALAGGGALTLGLALTRVLLPYDEHYLGMTTELLQRSSPRLVAFMAHDRATLAGTMLGLGWLYVMIAQHGIRRDIHGARTAIVASALTGFASFFAFLGFGYLDTLHAFVAAVLFQLTVQVMAGARDAAPASPDSAPPDEEDAAWRRAQWGQFLWVLHAAGLLGAGAIILWIGMTSVFVSEDLAFLCIDREQAQAWGARIVGVVAHDRATLGGMLLASGIAMLLPVLWCFRRGAAWLWNAIAGLGVPAYVAALGIHFRVGYTDWRHLAPALAGAALWAAGLGLSRSYLSQPGPPLRAR